MAAFRVLALLGLLAASAPIAAQDGQNSGRQSLFPVLQPELVAPAGTAVGDEAYAAQLVGLFVDRSEVATVEAIRHGELWFLPLDAVARHFDIDYRIDSDELRIATPQGGFGMPSAFVLDVAGRLYVSSRGLIESLMFEIEFDSRAWALRVFLPWTSEAVTATSSIAIEPDVVPARFSLSQLRSDIYYTDVYSDSDEDIGNLRTVSQLRGNLGSGVWHAQYASDGRSGNRFDEFYWVRAEANSQFLAGRDVISPNPLVPGTEMTGFQWAWSNREIGQNTGRQTDINSFYQAASSTPRRIHGTAEPGAVAELWVEGTRKAITRVRLDGTFEFLEVELLGQQYNEIEVLIYNRQRTALLERIDYSMLGTNKLLNQGQSLVYGGGGVSGNWLSDDRDETGNQDTTGALMLRHGVAAGLTLEASYTDNAAGQFQSLGFSSLLARRVAVNGSAAFNNGVGAYSLEGGSQGENWRAFVSSRVFDAGYRGPDAPRELHQYLDAQYRVGSQLQVYLRGRNSNNGMGGTERFLRPGVGWFAQGWSLRAAPSFNGDYRFEARLNRGALSASFLHEDLQNQIAVSHRLQPDLTFFGSVRQGDELPSRAEFGVDWFPNSLADRNSRMQASLIGSVGYGAGFSFVWQSSLAPGVYTDIQLIRDPAAAGFLGEDETRLMMRFTVDFAFNGRRLVPAESFTPRLNTGSLSGQLLIDDETGTELDDVDVIAVKIDNILHRVPLRGKFFYLENIPAGVHRIELDPGLLPIELTPAGVSLWVKIAPGAVTSMDFELEFLTGFAGRVTDSRGEPMPYAIVTVSGGDVPRHIRTDRFGLYRIDGLAPGSYRLVVGDSNGIPVGTGQVELGREYLFSQDVQTF